MKYIYTDLFADFSCVGGSCPATCCAGWDIFVEQDTYNKYLTLEESLRSKICDNIEESDEKLHKMRLIEGKRCPFLNEDNLCDIYIQLSPDAMCYTCKTYPRKKILYNDVVLATVVTSCPEVVRMLLNSESTLTFGVQEDSDVPVAESMDWELYNELINGLVITTEIIQDGQHPFWKRLYLVMQMALQIQQNIENGRVQEIREEIECYRAPEYRQMQMEALKQQSKAGNWKFIYELFSEMERLKNSSVMKHFDLVDYKMIDKSDEDRFRNWRECYRNVERESEDLNLALAYVFEDYMEALQGKNLFEAITKMALRLLIIKSSEILEYNSRGELPEEQKILLISNISRIMEHSAMLDVIIAGMMKNNEREALFQLAYFLS